MSAGADQVRHSTPIRITSTRSGAVKKSAVGKYCFWLIDIFIVFILVEFSDDDEDVDFGQPIQGHQNGVKNKVVANRNGDILRRGTNTISNNHHNYAADCAQLSEDEEEITIIRRINRYFITTVRNFFSGNNQDDEEEVNHETADINVNTARTHRSTNNRQTRKTNRYLGQFPDDGHANSLKNLCLFWPLLLLLPILLSCGVYYFGYSNGNNLNNLFDDFSQSSSAKISYLFDQFRFAPSSSSPGAGHFQDLSQFNTEIQMLRNEIQTMKNRYELDSLDGVSNDGGASSSPPPSDGPNFDEILDRLAKLEIKVTNCCQSSAATNMTETIESEVKHILDSKLYMFQAQYDKQLEQEIDKIKNHLITIVREQAANHSKVTARSNGSIDPTQIETMIRTAISKYDADKTGEADYALESSGK